MQHLNLAETFHRALRGMLILADKREVDLS